MGQGGGIDLLAGDDRIHPDRHPIRDGGIQGERGYVCVGKFQLQLVQKLAHRFTVCHDAGICPPETEEYFLAPLDRRSRSLRCSGCLAAFESQHMAAVGYDVGFGIGREGKRGQQQNTEGKQGKPDEAVGHGKPPGK